jgi:hypothetical protein
MPPTVKSHISLRTAVGCAPPADRGAWADGDVHAGLGVVADQGAEVWGAAAVETVGQTEDGFASGRVMSRVRRMAATATFADRGSPSPRRVRLMPTRCPRTLRAPTWALATSQLKPSGRPCLRGRLLGVRTDREQ